MSQVLIDRITARLAELKLSPRAASLLVSTNPDLLRGILRAGADANPTSDTLSKIAQALQTTPGWLRGEPDQPAPLPGRPEAQRADRAVPAREEMARDLPVWGSAAGSIINSNIEGVHIFTGEPVEYVRRPPALASVRDAYAIYVTGDSMAPRHNNGDLCFVHPHRPPSPGDTVIVQTRNWDHDPGQGYIKTFRRRKADEIILEQLNPLATITVPLRYVVALHRVMTLNDLFGV